MKILFLAPYIYDSMHKEFSKNKTGFGYMVKDIITQMCQTDDCYLVTHVITNGYADNYKTVRHKVRDILFHLNIRDVAIGVKYMLTFKQPLTIRLRYLYYFMDKGYTRNVLKDLKPDLAHIHGATYQTKPYIDLCETLKIPYVLTLHGANGCSENNLATLYDRNYEKELLKRFDQTGQKVTVVSSGVRSQLLDAYQLKGDNIQVVLNGTPIVNNSEERKKNRANKIVLVIGNISKHKNQLQVIEAYDLMTYAQKRVTEIYFCGANAQQLPIEESIKKTTFPLNLHYMGFVERNELEKLWQKADLNVVASIEEGFGLSIIEGFMHGVPTITFADLQVVKDINNHDAVELVCQRSNQALADGIEVALKKKWNDKKIKEYALSFSIEKIGSIYRSIYMEILENYDR